MIGIAQSGHNRRAHARRSRSQRSYKGCRRHTRRRGPSRSPLQLRTIFRVKLHRWPDAVRTLSGSVHRPRRAGRRVGRRLLLRAAVQAWRTAAPDQVAAVPAGVPRLGPSAPASSRGWPIERSGPLMARCRSAARSSPSRCRRPFARDLLPSEPVGIHRHWGSTAQRGSNASQDAHGPERVVVVLAPDGGTAHAY